MGTAALSLSDWRSFQGVRRLHARIGVGSAERQQSFRYDHVHSHFSDCSQDIRGERREMVGVCVGAESLRVVLVDSLDLGYDVYAVHPRVRVPAGTGAARLAGMARLGAVRRALRHRRAGQSHDAHVPALLRVVDLAAALSPKPGVLAGIVIASVVFWTALSPWLVRNYAVFGHFLLRDDFGLQFRLGNGPYAEGMLMPYLQPHHNKLEWEKFHQMGELAYGESCKQEAFYRG